MICFMSNKHWQIDLHRLKGVDRSALWHILAYMQIDMSILKYDYWLDLYDFERHSLELRGEAVAPTAFSVLSTDLYTTFFVNKYIPRQEAYNNLLCFLARYICA